MSAGVFETWDLCDEERCLLACKHDVFLPFQLTESLSCQSLSFFVYSVLATRGRRLRIGTL